MTPLTPTLAWPTLGTSALLAEVTRSSIVEGGHHGVFVVTDPQGAPLVSLGDHSQHILPRSVLKPVQAWAMLRAGLSLPPRLLALVCSSHSGEQMHLDGAAEILHGAGLTVEHLQTTAGLPINADAAAAWLAAGHSACSWTHNCSGKHSGMLAACVAAEWDTATYLNPAHPLQVAIRELMHELSGEPPAAVAVDGCGAPNPTCTLTTLSHMFGTIAAAQDGPAQRIAQAMCAHPEMVGGTGRDVTALMREVPGLVAKDGAEGVYAVGLPTGHGLAVKIADGAPRARIAVVAEALRRLGVLTAETIQAAHLTAPTLGHGRPVGDCVPHLPTFDAVSWPTIASGLR